MITKFTSQGLGRIYLHCSKMHVKNVKDGGRQTRGQKEEGFFSGKGFVKRTDMDFTQNMMNKTSLELIQEACMRESSLIVFRKQLEKGHQ